MTVTLSQDVPPEDQEGTETPDYPGTDPVPTPDYPGTDPKETPDYPGTDPVPTPGVGEHVATVPVFVPYLGQALAAAEATAGTL